MTNGGNEGGAEQLLGLLGLEQVHPEAVPGRHDLMLQLKKRKEKVWKIL
jgi:hypothetical protein